jgi:hypothetical protein
MRRYVWVFGVAFSLLLGLLVSGTAMAAGRSGLGEVTHTVTDTVSSVTKTVSPAGASGAGNNVNGGNTTSAGLIAVNDAVDLSLLNGANSKHSEANAGNNVNTHNTTSGGLIGANDLVDASALNGANANGKGAQANAGNNSNAGNTTTGGLIALNDLLNLGLLNGAKTNGGNHDCKVDCNDDHDCKVDCNDDHHEWNNGSNNGWDNGDNNGGVDGNTVTSPQQPENPSTMFPVLHPDNNDGLAPGYPAHEPRCEHRSPKPPAGDWMTGGEFVRSRPARCRDLQPGDGGNRRPSRPVAHGSTAVTGLRGRLSSLTPDPTLRYRLGRNKEDTRGLS